MSKNQTPRNRADLDAARVPMGERTPEEQREAMEWAASRLKAQMESPAFRAALEDTCRDCGDPITGGHLPGLCGPCSIAAESDPRTSSEEAR